MGNYPCKYGKPVEKIDRDGNVLDRYPSIEAAAKANPMPALAIGKRCRGLVKKPYERLGFSFRFGDLPTDRLVEKIDRDGRILDIYHSIADAAKSNYIDNKFVWDRCHNKPVSDPFRYLGFSFRFSGDAKE